MAQPKKYERTEPRTSIGSLPVMLDVATAAELGGYSRRHIINMLRNGTLRGVRLGRTWRIPRDGYLNFLGLEVQ